MVGDTTSSLWSWEVHRRHPCIFVPFQTVWWAGATGGRCPKDGQRTYIRGLAPWAMGESSQEAPEPLSDQEGAGCS